MSNNPSCHLPKLRRWANPLIHLLGISRGAIKDVSYTGAPLASTLQRTPSMQFSCAWCKILQGRGLVYTSHPTLLWMCTPRSRLMEHSALSLRLHHANTGLKAQPSRRRPECLYAVNARLPYPTRLPLHLVSVFVD